MRKDKSERVLRTAVLGFLILAGGAANAASVTVNFDVLPDGTPYQAQQTFAATAGPLREEYAAKGVHFTGGGGVLTGNFGVSGFSGANLLAFNARAAAAYANGSGPVPLPPEQIKLDQPANLVQVKVGSAEGGTATLTAYDAAGNTMGTAQLPLSSVAAPLQVQSANYNIASAQLALTGARSMAAGDLVFVLQDHLNVPPVTECALSGPAGANGWFTGDVQATLTATDADDQVVSTQCSLDGGTWQPYSAPVLVTGDGPHTLQYKSVDSSGLWENVKSDTINIDTTKPVVQLELSRHILWPPNGEMMPVVVSGTASDAAPGSGLANVSFQVQDKYGECQPTLTGFDQTIMLKASRNGNDHEGRWYKITATATDNAGLQTSVSQWVLVPHDHCHEKPEPPQPKQRPAVKGHPDAHTRSGRKTLHH
jgi:hypothetical protein